MPQDRPEEEGEKDKAGEPEDLVLQEVARRQRVLLGHTSYSVAFTDRPAKLREGLKPNSISIGYSGPKALGLEARRRRRRDQPRRRVQRQLQLLARRRRSWSTRRSRTSPTSTRFTRRARAPTWRTSGWPEADAAQPGARQVRAGLLRHADPLQRLEREGQRFHGAVRSEGEALGLKLGFGVDFKSESKVGWTRRRGSASAAATSRSSRRAAYRPRAGGLRAVGHDPADVEGVARQLRDRLLRRSEDDRSRRRAAREAAVAVHRDDDDRQHPAARRHGRAAALVALHPGHGPDEGLPLHAGRQRRRR